MDAEKGNWIFLEWNTRQRRRDFMFNGSTTAEEKSEQE